MRILHAALFATLGFSIACADLMPPSPDPVPPNPTPSSENPEQRAARIADSIKADPTKAGVVLKAEGMTEAEFEKLIYAIAKDPQRSKAFIAARKK